VAADDGVHLLEFAERRGLPRELERLRARRGVVCVGDHPLLDLLGVELQRYFAGAVGDVDVLLAPQGTPFERAVWRELRAIPCGVTRSYAAVAAAVGRPTAVRAVARERCEHRRDRGAVPSRDRRRRRADRIRRQTVAKAVAARARATVRDEPALKPARGGGADDRNPRPEPRAMLAA
jgi:alkylated DNA nucleotide flippase Atl1